MSADDESSWRLLFSIALSHGDALLSGQLTWDGWMVFLSSAQLIGTATGVFPVLLDQIWQRQALHVNPQLRREQARGNSSSTASSPSNSYNDAADRDATGDSTAHIDVVEFGGFTDMMKVLCVRVYQSFQFSMVQEEQQQQQQVDHRDAILVALRRCAENRVLLTEAVRFTASRYLRPFIAKSTIHASSKVSLRASRNGWAPHVNRLLTHIVGSLAQSTIVPLYRAYADAAAGRLTEDGFHAFVRDYLPGLNTIEETCALAIFTHGGFPNIRPLLKPLLPLAVSSPAVALLTATPTLGLTDFVEALLMLAVVVFADEAQHPSLRPVTAKVWTFFDRYVCSNKERGGGVGVSGAMCSDPYESGRYAAMPPGLVSVFPIVTPLLPSPTLFVEVCNATCCCGAPMRDATSPPSLKKEAQGQARRSPAPSVASPTSENTPFLTEVSLTDAANAVSDSLTSPPAPPGDTTQIASAAPKAAVEMASPFFASQWSLLERNADVALFGDGSSGATTACRVSIGGTLVDATPLAGCPELWQVDLAALALSSVRLTRCAVEGIAVASGSSVKESAPVGTTATTATATNVSDAATGAAGDGADHFPAVKLTFTPIRALPVELAQPAIEGQGHQRTGQSGVATVSTTPWGCRDVVLTDTSITQVVPSPLVRDLCSLFAHIPDASAEETTPEVTTTTANSHTLHMTYSMTAFCEVCQKLKWCGKLAGDSGESVEALCQRALTSCRRYQRTLHGSTTQREASAPAAADKAARRMSLTDVLVCLSLLLLEGNESGVRDIPDVPRRLELALHAAAPQPPRGTDAAEAAQTAMTSVDFSKSSGDTRSLPHNRLRDEPFRLALERKEAQSAASHERRAAVVKALQAHHQERMAGPTALPLLPETRPGAMRLVSQYGNVDPSSNFNAVMREGAETIKAYFIEKELAIPEWQGS